MKFPQLPVGERFEYQGETLVKIGPLTACHDHGGDSRLIPRSAVVTPTGAGAPVAAPAAAPALTPALVREALAACEVRWREAVGGLDEPTRGPIEAALTAAWGELAERLGISQDP